MGKSHDTPISESSQSDAAERRMDLVMDLIQGNLHAARAIELGKLLDAASKVMGIPRAVLFAEFQRRDTSRPTDSV